MSDIEDGIEDMGDKMKAASKAAATIQKKILIQNIRKKR
jgi:hypothetical protein